MAAAETRNSRRVTSVMAAPVATPSLLRQIRDRIQEHAKKFHYHVLACYDRAIRTNVEHRVTGHDIEP